MVDVNHDLMLCCISNVVKDTLIVQIVECGSLLKYLKHFVKSLHVKLLFICYSTSHCLLSSIKAQFVIFRVVVGYFFSVFSLYEMQNFILISDPYFYHLNPNTLIYITCCNVFPLRIREQHCELVF